MNNTDTQNYCGTELQTFAHANNWKEYVMRHIQPYIKGDVLEVGAGLGAFSRLFTALPLSTLTLLEPDSGMAKTLRETYNKEENGSSTVISGTMEDIPIASEFDTILYLDVLEHIEDDYGEIGRAFQHLRDGGHLIILAPAFQFFFSDFDKSIGHFRRYSHQTLEPLVCRRGYILLIRYLDSWGSLLSFVNKVFIRSSNPTHSQVRFWDKAIVPLSSFFDKIIRWKFGRSILMVAKKALQSHESEETCTYNITHGTQYPCSCDHETG